MNNDLEIIHQVLGREIDNVINMLFPQFNVLGGRIKNYAFEKIDPLLLMFDGANNTVDIETAGAFIENELKDKISNFKEKIKQERGDINA